MYAGIGRLGTKGTTAVGRSPEEPSYRLPRMSQEDLDETPCKILRPNQMLIHTTLHTLDAYSISSGSVALLRQ